MPAVGNEQMFPLDAGPSPGSRPSHYHKLVKIDSPGPGSARQHVCLQSLRAGRSAALIAAMGPGTPGPAESGAIEMSDKLLKPCIFKTKVTARLTAPRDRNLLALALAILIAFPSLLKAGEVEGLYEAKIDDADVSAKSPPIKVGPHQKFKLCAIASGYYTYSGQQDTFFGIPIEVSPASTNEEAALTGSVGAGGRNRPGDVRSVQRALIALGSYTDPANGQVSNNLLAAITAFQKQSAPEEADGSIKPNSKTASLLFSKKRYAMFPLRGEVAIAPDGEGYTFQPAPMKQDAMPLAFAAWKSRRQEQQAGTP